MIFGSFSFADGTAPAADFSTSPDGFEELVVHSVACRGFQGGYLTHPGLPYHQDDFYYREESRDIMVLMWGSIYNKTELCRLYDFSPGVPDPQLAASMFLSEGPAFAGKLNGEFAAFILQPSKKEAYLLRDQVGIKPLAWRTDATTLSFSCDIFGFCRVFSQDGSPDRDYLLGFFKYNDFRGLPEPSVNKLLPGHFIGFSAVGLTITKYWFPEKIRIDRYMTYENMIGHLRDLLHDAVRIRSDARFKAGAHVSSGLDSGIVSALARKEYADQSSFPGFSWSPDNFVAPGIKYDERDIVREFCRKTGITPVFSAMNSEVFPHFVSSFYFNHGFYAEDITISQAKSMGINLLFSGWGGDEFISTGDRGIEMDLLKQLKIKLFLKRNPLRPFKKFVRNQLDFVVYPFIGVLNRSTARSFDNEARYIRKPYKRSDKKAIRTFYFHRSRRQMHLRMLDFYHLQDRCETWAVNGYRNGIEYRYPLLDKRIIEYMISVPTELLCKEYCYRPLLREIGLNIIPDEIRLHWEKADHVFGESLNKVYNESAELFMDEYETWRNNRDLDFIDFDLLCKDIARYRSGDGKLNRKLFTRLLVLIKGVHEFSKQYRR